MKRMITTASLIMAVFVPVWANAEDAKAKPASDAAVAAASVTAPVDVGNKICPVSGEKIVNKTDMGGPVKIEYKGKLYGLCCPMCIKDFKKTPDKYAAIADKEVADASVTP